MASTKPSSTTSKPSILGSVSLPPLLSFTSGEEPHLLLSLTLMDFDTPITFALSHTRFERIESCLDFRNSRICHPQYLPTTEVQRRNVPPLLLCAERETDFVTLRPGEPYVFDVNFRPFGDEIFNEEHWRNMPQTERFRRGLTMGMHTLDIGEAYEMGIIENLSIWGWLPGDKTDMIPAKGQEPVLWQPGVARLQIVSAPPTQFIVQA